MLKPLSWNPACLVRRRRLFAGGVLIEDVDAFNRLSLMLTALKPEDEQNCLAIEGFGTYDERSDQLGSTLDRNPADDHRKSYRLRDSDEGGNIRSPRKVMFEPMLGLFGQGKLLPLKYFGGIQFELELVNDMADAFWRGVDASQFYYDSVWDLTDIQCKCDLLTLDNSLDNEYASHLLSGKRLPINFNTWNHTNQSTGGDNDLSIHIDRGLTRLKSVFITLSNPDNSS